MTSTQGSRGDRKNRHLGSLNEVDALRNPTELFQRINSEDWEGALRSVRNDPDGASVWISRHNGDENGLTWKYLPLHLICLQQRPPMELLLELLRVYPQAASLPTPHDGNLPLHYVCEGGCDDENVFASLLASFPGSLERENKKGKSPFLVCHPKSRSVLMKVMRLRKSLPFANVQQTRKRNTSKSKAAEQRDDRHSLEKDSRHDVIHRRSTKSEPCTAKNVKDQKYFAPNTDEACEWKNAKTPKTSNHRRRSSKKQPLKEEPAFTFFPTTDSYRSTRGGGGESDSSSYFSSKTSELARSALNFLYPSYQDESEPRDKQKEYPLHAHVKSLAAKILDQPNSTDDADADESKLCERILAQAEADNVAFRTQIQQLQEEKAEIKRAGALQANEFGEFIATIKTIVNEKCSNLKITALGDGSSSDDISSDGRTQIVEAIQSLFTHMDERKSNLFSKIALLETDLSESEVALNLIQSKNDLLQDDKNSMAKRCRELESQVLILEEDQLASNKEIIALKDRANGLKLMNQALHDQISSSGQWKQEEIKLRSELDRLNALLIQTKEQHRAEVEAKVKSMLDKNQTLNDTILANNENYSKKVQDLSEKCSSLEKENKELRKKLEKKKLSSGSESDVKVQLGRENSLLYEV